MVREYDLAQWTMLPPVRSPEYLQERAQDYALPLPYVQKDLQCPDALGQQPTSLETTDLEMTLPIKVYPLIKLRLDLTHGWFLLRRIRAGQEVQRPRKGR